MCDYGTTLYRYEIRHVDDVPWPHGLGGGNHPELQDAMRAHLGDRWGVPATNEWAFHHDPEYRRIAQFYLAQADFTADLTTVVSQATSLAANLPLLNRVSEREEWQAGVAALCEANEIDTRWGGRDFQLVRYLREPLDFSSSNEAPFNNGRHRITWLRLRHLDCSGPSQLLVAYMLPS